MVGAGWSASARSLGWKAKSFRCTKFSGSSRNILTTRGTFTEPTRRPEFGQRSWPTLSIWGSTFRALNSILAGLCETDDRNRTLAHLRARLRGGAAWRARPVLGAVQG